MVTPPAFTVVSSGLRPEKSPLPSNDPHDFRLQWTLIRTLGSAHQRTLYAVAAAVTVIKPEEPG